MIWRHRVLRPEHSKILVEVSFETTCLSVVHIHCATRSRSLVYLFMSAPTLVHICSLAIQITTSLLRVSVK